MAQSENEEEKSVESSVSSLFAPHYYNEFKMSKVVEKTGVLTTTTKISNVADAKKSSMFGKGKSMFGTGKSMFGPGFGMKND